MCFTRAVGVYPIRWHHMMDDGPVFDPNDSSMHVNYCAGTACTPTVAIPSSMLRVSP